jgi:propionate catabolism operon transcriptional regulator
MDTQRIKVGFINRTQEFIDCALAASAKVDMEVVTALAGLDAAVQAGKRMEAEGVEAIISRRGTAEWLRKSLRIPVLAVRISSLDILRNVKEASSFARKILLTLFEDESFDTALLEALFGVTLVPGVFHDNASLDATISWAKEQGCEAVIGGGGSMAFARKHGLKGVELRTDEYAILSALRDAASVVRTRREEQEKALRYRTIMDATSEGIAALDNKGNIAAINRAARDFFEAPGEELVGRHVSTCLPAEGIGEVMESRSPLWHRLENFDGKMFVVNYIPLLVGPDLVGLVLTFKDAANVVRAENVVRRAFVKRLTARYTVNDLIHRHPRMVEVVEKIRRFSPVNATVLITGETGTGKEIVAQSIHNLGPRRGRPFVSLNCAALPDQLLESELFGYEEGAFTGSRRGGKPGLFELAHTGTIFLDEIGATTLNMQSRLLRVIQEREVMRIGGDRWIPVDVRIIAATNRNLSREVQEGRFREDLYFRLDVLTIFIPPLRERIEDLPLLLEDLIARFARHNRVRPLTIPAQQVERLMGMHWPGNVRQLRNFVEKLVILCGDEFKPLVFDELYCGLLGYSLECLPKSDGSQPPLREYVRHKMREDESRSIRGALEKARYNRSLAARRLGISRTTLWRKLKEMGEGAE